MDVSFNPLGMRFDITRRESDQLYATVLEFMLFLDKACNFGGANRGEIAWMRKQDSPTLINIGMEVEIHFRRSGLEV